MCTCRQHSAVSGMNEHCVMPKTEQHVYIVPHVNRNGPGSSMSCRTMLASCGPAKKTSRKWPLFTTQPLVPSVHTEKTPLNISQRVHARTQIYMYKTLSRHVENAGGEGAAGTHHRKETRFLISPPQTEVTYGGCPPAGWFHIPTYIFPAI